MPSLRSEPAVERAAFGFAGGPIRRRWPSGAVHAGRASHRRHVSHRRHSANFYRRIVPAIATGGKPNKPVKCSKTGPTIYDNAYVVGVVVEQCPYPLFLSPVYLTSPSWA